MLVGYYSVLSGSSTVAPVDTYLSLMNLSVAAVAVVLMTDFVAYLKSYHMNHVVFFVDSVGLACCLSAYY